MEVGEIDNVQPFPRQPRRGSRDRVIRRVQLIVGARTLDAVMLDVSEGGARLQLSAPTELPEEFVLRSADGVSRRVARRWMQDGQLGLQYTGAEEAAAPPPPGNRQAVLEMLRGRPVLEALHELGAMGHLDDEALRVAARDLTVALERLEHALLHPPRRRPNE